MRVNNAIRERISQTVDKAMNKKINELNAKRIAQMEGLQKELDALVQEMNERAAKILAFNAPVGSKFKSFGYEGNFVCNVARVELPKDDKLDAEIAEVRAKAGDMKLDLEIRCQLEKDADKFFQMMAEVEF